MNFFDYLGFDTEENFQRHESAGSFLEITEIVEDQSYTANAIPSKLRAIIQSASYVDISLASAMDLSFGEVIDNVLNHSRTEVPGIAVAQHYPKMGYVEFCVADAGIGISESLRNNPKYQERSSSELMESAFQYGVGENVRGARGGEDGYGCGYGLAFTAKLVEAADGELWAISRDDCIHMTSSEIEHVSGCWFPGTIVCARIPDRAVLSESALDVTGSVRSNRPYYWDSEGNELDDLYERDGILW